MIRFGKETIKLHALIVVASVALNDIRKEINLEAYDANFVVNSYIDNIATLRAFIKANNNKINWAALLAVLNENQIRMLNKIR